MLNVAQTNRRAVIVQTQVPCQIEISLAIRYQLSELSKYDCHICWKCIGWGWGVNAVLLFQIDFPNAGQKRAHVQARKLFNPSNKA